MLCSFWVGNKMIENELLIFGPSPPLIHSIQIALPRPPQNSSKMAKRENVGKIA